jgi:hypothetical protein
MLVCRQWDGIDKPAYTPILQLTTDEHALFEDGRRWQRAGRLKNFGGELTHKVPYSVMLGEWKPYSLLGYFLFDELQGSWYLDCDPLFWIIGFDEKSDFTRLLLKFKGQTEYFLEALKH